MRLLPSRFVKIRVAVPIEAADKIRRALAEAGAGRQGNYEACSGSHRQTGRFQPMPGSSPAIGSVGKLETVEEELIETLCEEALIKQAIAAIIAAHPYEEPAIDIIPRMEIE
ncbi:MAG: hypothetical protein M1275_00235 [Patescibacteria group bacterium]|nr:hypothetical protein [Patescibacteria group bacterium]